jgi:hypothetical protein
MEKVLSTSRKKSRILFFKVLIPKITISELRIFRI